MEAILESIFLKVLNMSMTASYIIIAVIVARFLLKKAPKKYSYALWAAAGFRLVCPVSFKSVFSLLALKPLSMPVEELASGAGTQIVHIQPDIGFMTQPEIHTGLEAVNAAVNDSLPAATPMASANPIQIWTFIGMLLWLVGIAALLAISAVSLWRLCRRLRTATLLEGNVRQSENVRSPFIVGLFRPKIYIPYGLTETQLNHVLAHERAHIKRFDHVVRTLSYLVLCVHWFNPLVWLAYYLMGRDMELSCDEKVLGRISDKAEYSETLLSFASSHRFPAPTPLAFGESAVGSRIKNALRWHRPRLWVSIIAFVCCVVLLLACAANPRESGEKDELWGDWVPVGYDYLSPASSTVFMDGNNGKLYRISEEDGLTVRNHFNPTDNVMEIYDAEWGWQDFPYTDEEWENMIVLYSGSFPAPISEMYEEILYQPLTDKTYYAVSYTDAPQTENFLLRLDGELKMVYSTVAADGTQTVYSILSLDRVEDLGTATFTYAPEKTSNEPGIEIYFPAEYEVAYRCYNGSIAAYNAVGERFAEGENLDSEDICHGHIPVGGKLIWSPVKKTDKGVRTAEYDSININIWTGFNVFSGDIYIDSDDGVYTLTTAGSNTRLRQNSDGSVSVVLSDEAKYLTENHVWTPDELPDEKCPYDWTSTVRVKDIKKLTGFNIDEDILETPEFAEALVKALGSAEKSDFTKESKAVADCSMVLDVHCGTDIYTLMYYDGVVSFSFSDSLKSSDYPDNGKTGTWRLRCDELNELFESAYLVSHVPTASATDLGDGSPWAFLTGLSADKISGIMIDGDPAAVENAADPSAVADAVVAALNKVDSTEISAGRGAPNQYNIGFNYDNDASYITLGYCGDFVELQLQGEAAEEYSPVGGPTWEIHNDALTELLVSLIRPTVTEFEFSLSENEGENGVLLRFDPRDFDKVDVLNYFTCFPDETGSHPGGSTTGNPVAERWQPDKMVTENGKALAESGGILLTVRKGNGYAQGLLVFEGTATEKDARELVCGAKYKVYLEGPFTYTLSEDDREVTLSLDEDWLKPTPAYLFSSMVYSDLTGFELSGNMDGKILSAGIRDQEIIDILKILKPDELEIKTGGFHTEECKAILNTADGTIVLSYGNGETRMSFEGAYSAFSEIEGSWITRNDALTELFEEIAAK